MMKNNENMDNDVNGAGSKESERPSSGNGNTSENQAVIMLL